MNKRGSTRKDENKNKKSKNENAKVKNLRKNIEEYKTKISNTYFSLINFIFMTCVLFCFDVFKNHCMF